MQKDSSARSVQALFENGAAAHKSGDFLRARAFYEQALALRPDEPAILQNMGFLLLSHRRHADALHYLQRALAQPAAPVSVLKAFAVCLARTGRYPQAFEAFTRYRSAAAADIEITSDYLQTCMALQRYADILAFASTFADAGPLAGIVTVYAAEAEMAQGQPDKAIDRLESAQKKMPSGSILLLPALSKAYGRARNFAKALELARVCADAEPHEAMHWNNLGNAERDCGQHEAALESYARARALNPKLAAATLTNEAYIYKRLRQPARAMELAAAALEIEPANPQARYAFGTLSLMAGHYANAWPNIEWRWHRDESTVITPPSVDKIWYGQPLAGRSLCIYADQGIGDTVMMLRYIRLIQKVYAPAKIVVSAQQKLRNLFASAFTDGSIAFAATDANPPEKAKADYIVAFCSLPNIFGTTLETVPPCEPPLGGLSQKNYRTPEQPLVVGLSWYTKSPDAGYKRSLALSAFAFLKDIPGVRVLDLQYGDTRDERENVAREGFDLLHDDTVDSWTDAQGLVDQLHACDLVISIDNTTVHAAGAAHVPVWTLLPYDPYWRWHAGDSTPWYPTMRIFRQQQEGDYTAPLTHIKAELEKLAAGDRSVLVPPAFDISVMGELPQKPDATALLLNDTYAWYHWGCTATSGAIREELKNKGYAVASIPHREIADNRLPAPRLPDFDDPRYLARARYLNPTLYKAMAEAACIVINGEGTIHGTADNALRLLYLAYVAGSVFQKPVHIINHACYPQDSMTLSDPNIIAYYLKGYRTAASIAVRDEGSHSLLTQLGFKPVQAFDSLPLAASRWLEQRGTLPDVDSKHIILAGSSKLSLGKAADFYDYFAAMTKEGYRFTCLVGAKAHPAADDSDFIEMLKRSPIPIAVKTASSLDEWFTEIASAALLVSGRFHYTIAAACLGTPFVAFEGNTPKLDNLCKKLKQESPLRFDQENLFKVLSNRTKIALAADRTRLRMDSQAITQDLCKEALRNYAAIASIKNI